MSKEAIQPQAAARPIPGQTAAGKASPLRILSDALNQITVQNAVQGSDVNIVDAREQLLKEMGAAVVQHTGVEVIFAISVDIVNSDKTKVGLLGSRFEKVPDNVRKWAGRSGIRSCISNQNIQEKSGPADATVQLVATPMKDVPDQLEALVSLATGTVGSNSPEELNSIHSLVESGLRQWRLTRELARQKNQTRDLASITELISRIETASSPETACQRFADELEQHINTLGGQKESDGAEQVRVYVALADKQGEIELSAISSSNSAPVENKATTLCEGAMRESISRRKLSVWPAVETDRHSLLCHEQFGKHCGANCLVSLPLHSMDGKLQGVAMAVSDSHVPERVQNFLAASGTAIATSLALITKAKRSKLQLMIDKTVDSFRDNKSAMMMKIAAVLLTVGLIPLPYKVSTQCEVQPLEKRYIAAPFAGQLQECLVEPGDTVSPNQVLARMDDREIRMELAEVEADLHRAMKTRDGHVASHESGEARLAELEAQRLSARRDLLHHRSEHLELKSPLAGVVITGELKRAQGMPLEIGQSLFEVAPLNELIAEVAIPEDDIRYVQPGMSVKVKINSIPFESWTGEIERVHPAAEILDDNNVFVANVRINDEQGRLKPGMRGYGKISTVWRPIAWNYLHKPAARVLRWIGW